MPFSPLPRGSEVYTADRNAPQSQMFILFTQNVFLCISPPPGREGVPTVRPLSVILFHTQFFWSPALTLLSHTSVYLSTAQCSSGQNPKRETSFLPLKESLLNLATSSRHSLHHQISVRDSFTLFFFLHQNSWPESHDLNFTSTSLRKTVKSSQRP